MFNSSGSMYEEIEQNRMKKLRQRKIMKRRIIVIVVLSILVLYLGLLLNDMRRFKKGDYPLITFSKKIKEYDDGKVETYTSLGWVFRYYFRETINTQEIVPFWSPIIMDDVLNRIVYDENLPEVEVEYKIPDNGNKRSKVGSVLFFYDDDKKLLGTYKCILSESDCDFATSAYLDQDKGSRPSNVPMGIIDNRYVFIVEYKSKNTSVEEKYVYLYDINAKHLLAQYQDVRYSKLIEKDKEQVGTSEGSKYIAKKNGYWGIDDVNKGKVTNFVNYEYNLISYHEETMLYIFANKQNKWVIFNPNNKVYTSPIDKIIESVHYKNGKAYVVAYETVDYNTKNYYLYDEDGNNVLVKENVDNLRAYNDFLVYAKDDTIYIIDYDGREAAESIKLYINLDSAFNYTSVKPYSVEVIDKTLVISVPQTQERTHFSDIYYYNMDTLELINVRQNVKESLY